MENAIIIDKTNVDTACEAQAAFIERFALDHEPNVIVENDGIGSYEYWGAKCFDAGKDCAIIDGGDDLHTFTIDVTGCDEDFIDSLAAIDGEFMAHHSYEFNRCELSIRFLVKFVKVENGIMTLTGQWTDK